MGPKEHTSCDITWKVLKQNQFHDTLSTFHFSLFIKYRPPKKGNDFEFCIKNELPLYTYLNLRNSDKLDSD